MTFEEIEKHVSRRAGSYNGLSCEALLTSEADYLTIFEALPNVQKWIEPGSGHGLGPVLFAQYSPLKTSLGIEFEGARFEASLLEVKRLGLLNAEFIHADLSNTDLPIGDTYFLYFPTGIVLDRMLYQLGQRSDFFRIIAIESHGDLLPRLQKLNWLKQVQSIPLSQPRHADHALVFEKIAQPESSLHDVSFTHSILEIQDQNQDIWLGDCYGLEWLRGNEFALMTPPRTIHSHQVKNCCPLAAQPALFHPALRLRRLGELTIVLNDRTLRGQLRKIFVSPSFKVEISTGEQVEWSQIEQIFWENTLCYDSLSDFYFYPLAV